LNKKKIAGYGKGPNGKKRKSNWTSVGGCLSLLYWRKGKESGNVRRATKKGKHTKKKVRVGENTAVRLNSKSAGEGEKTTS